VITGTVNADLEATVDLTVRGPGDRERGVRAVLDTGFDGWLTLPAAVIGSLRLAHRGRVPAMLADGTRTEFDIYAATILWDGTARPVPVGAAEGTALVGMSLLEGSRLTVEVKDGGLVRIEAPSPR
jgi:clan AA aspartic protease